MYTARDGNEVVFIIVCKSNNVLFESQPRARRIKRLQETTLCKEMRLRSSSFSSDLGRYNLIIHLVTSPIKLHV